MNKNFFRNIFAKFRKKQEYNTLGDVKAQLELANKNLPQVINSRSDIVPFDYSLIETISPDVSSESLKNLTASFEKYLEKVLGAIIKGNFKDKEFLWDAFSLKAKRDFNAVLSKKLSQCIAYQDKKKEIERAKVDEEFNNEADAITAKTRKKILEEGTKNLARTKEEMKAAYDWMGIPYTEAELDARLEREQQVALAKFLRTKEAKKINDAATKEIEEKKKAANSKKSNISVNINNEKGNLKSLKSKSGKTAKQSDEEYKALKDKVYKEYDKLVEANKKDVEAARSQNKEAAKVRKEERKAGRKDLKEVFVGENSIGKKVKSLIEKRKSNKAERLDEKVEAENLKKEQTNENLAHQTRVDKINKNERNEIRKRGSQTLVIPTLEERRAAAHLLGQKFDENAVAKDIEMETAEGLYAFRKTAEGKEIVERYAGQREKANIDHAKEAGKIESRINEHNTKVAENEKARTEALKEKKTDIKAAVKSVGTKTKEAIKKLKDDIKARATQRRVKQAKKAAKAKEMEFVEDYFMDL